MVAQIDTCVLGTKKVQWQCQMVFDTSRRETISHLFELGICARAKMIHEDTHFDTTTCSAFQRSKDALGLLCPAHCKVFDVDELPCSVDVFGNTRKDRMIIGKQLDGIASKGWQSTQVGIELHERFVVRWN